MTLIAALLLLAQEGLTLEVETARAVEDAPVSCAVDVDTSKPWRLIDADGFLRCLPHVHDMDGFFAARMERVT